MSVDKPTPNDVVEVLDKAIELMNDTGKHWTQGRFKVGLNINDDGVVVDYAYCAVGAIRAASGVKMVDYGSNPLADAAVEAVARATIPHVKNSREDERSSLAVTPVTVVTGWNDNDGTNWEKVVRRFQRARTRVLKRADKGLSGF